jgi:hypothetical protein
MGFRFHTRLGRGVGVSLGRGGARLYAGGRRGFVSAGSSGIRATARLGRHVSYTMSRGGRSRGGGVLGFLILLVLLGLILRGLGLAH